MKEPLLAKRHAIQDRELILKGEKRFLTEWELALYLSRSERWCRLMRKRRLLPYSKIGSAVRYETAKVDEALRALSKPTVLPGKRGAK